MFFEATPTTRQMYDLNHRAIHEQNRVQMTPPNRGEATDHFYGGLSRVYATFADQAERVGFRVARGGEQALIEDLCRDPRAVEALQSARNRAALAQPGSVADAALQDAVAAAGVLGRLHRQTQLALLAPTARAAAMGLRNDFGTAKAAHIVADALRNVEALAPGQSPNMAAMADADLNMAGGLAENLTQYLYMAFTEPRPPLHYEQVFKVQGGINIGLLSLQVLFYRIRGEARVWDGGEGDYGNSGPGVAQYRAPVIHLRSSDNLNIIDQAREVLIYGAANLRTEQLYAAHEFAANRLAWGLQVPSPNQLQPLSLKNWPGVTKIALDGTLATLTATDLYNALTDAINTPIIKSNQAFMPDRLYVTPAIRQAMDKVYVVGGTGTATTVAGMFAQAHPEVKVEVVWELSDLFATGTDAFFACPSTGPAAPVFLRNAPLMLPTYSYGTGIRRDVYSTVAGLVWGAPVGALIFTIDRV